MISKLIPFVLSIMCIILFNSPAWSLVEGSWDVNGKTVVKVTIKGYGTEKETSYFEDECVFYSDGTFEMIDLEGTWKQKGRKFTVSIMPEDLEDYFEDTSEEMLDAEVDVDIISFSFSGSENKPSSKITGTMKMKMYLYVYDYDLEGTIIVTSTFKGYRTYDESSGGEPPFADKVSAPLLDTVAEAIDSGSHFEERRKIND
jgi:hypothetical protein